MLASTPNILQMCSFDATKSTKGASKLRRDLINSEIANLRDLLPLPSSTRQRLSQLQLMALVCVYVRKANYFQHAFRKHDLTPEVPIPHFGFSKALNGFLMMMTQNGKLLYISDNAAEYLGHSMEDLLIHGDSVYDIIEKQDHQTIQSELMRTPNPLSIAPDNRIFLCRMNVSRNARRQMRFGDQKVVLIQGHFVSFLPLCSRNEPVFLATCTPVAMPETRECVVQGSTNVFTTIHSMDLKFLHIDRNGEFHLGYNKNNIQGLSWYDFVHWEHLREAQSKHRLITQSEQERSCILLLRLQTMSHSWIWVHVVLQVKDSNDSSQQPVIVCTNQVLSDREAAVMRANNWLYQFYSLHSKMHYGLAYDAHTARLPTYYPNINATPAVMSHAYHHAVSAGGAEAAAMPLHSVPYHHIHSAITPLNGSPGHRHPNHPHHHPHHPQAVLQYSPQAGTLPYPSIVAAVNATTQSLTDAETTSSHNKNNSSSHAKRALSTESVENQEADGTESPEPPSKKPNLSHHSLPPTSAYHHHPRASSFTYPTSMFGTGGFASSMSSVAELGSVVPSYYGGPQMLSTVPYHAQIGHHFRNQNKFSLLTEGADCAELDAQSVMATNLDDVSNLITFSTPAYFKYSSPSSSNTLQSYQYYNISPSDRDLDKSKSPESIISTTSDYASMTSLSPPAGPFEKTDKKESMFETGDSSYHDSDASGDASHSSSYGFKAAWNAVPTTTYTDLSSSRPPNQFLNHLEKESSESFSSNKFSNLNWDNNNYHPVSNINKLNEKDCSTNAVHGQVSDSMSSGRASLSQANIHQDQQQYSASNNEVSMRVVVDVLPVNNREVDLVNMTESGHSATTHTHMHPQVQAEIPSSSLSTPSAPSTSSGEASPSSVGVGRALGYSGMQNTNSIAKGDARRKAQATAQESAGI